MWNELRAPREYRELREHPVWDGEGIAPGRGRRIMLLGGWMAAPRSTGALAEALERAGWRPHRPAIGRNAKAAYAAIDVAVDDLRSALETDGEPMTVLGHSRGGQYARIIGVRHPELVSSIVTLSAPTRVRYPPFIAVNWPANVFDVMVRRGWFGAVEEPREDEVDVDQQRPFPDEVPWVAIWSKTDGLVDWRFCVDDAALNLEIDASHLGVCNSTAGLVAVGRALELVDRHGADVRGLDAGAVAADLADSSTD